MSPDHARFADWDAAFVLGALSPSDRRLFEAHLQECALCRDAIVETAPTIALLARVTPDRAESLLEPEAAGDGPDLARRRELIAAGVGEAQRRRRIRWAAGLSAAAAVLIAAVIVAVMTLAPGTRDARVIAL
jgi:anti-sigma factor RsiW